MTPIQYKRPFYQIVESNRIEKRFVSVNRIQPNRFFFHESECSSNHVPLHSLENQSMSCAVWHRLHWENPTVMLLKPIVSISAGDYIP